MVRFNYVARDSSGASQDGEITANTERDAARLLRAQGKYVVGLRQLAAQKNRDSGQVLVPGGSRVKQEEIIFFFCQLSIMVETGVSLADAIDAIIAQSPPGRFHHVLKDVEGSVESGKSFSAALACHPKVFGDFYVNLLRAAEASGTMASMLRRCADYLAARREIQKKVKAALRYPLILSMAAAGVTAFLMTYVMPKFLSIYAGKEATLPAPTLILIAITDWLVGSWMLVLGGTVLAAAAAVWFFRAAVTQPYAHWVQLRIPLIGKMVQRSYITSSLRTLGILVDSGVSMLEAVGITRALSTNYYFGRMWQSVTERLHDGDQLSAPLREDPLMPRSVVQMIEAGEKSGQLGAVLMRLCDYLDEELRDTIKAMTQTLEPLMIAVIGVIVGGISVALLLPILTISKVVAH